MPERPGFCVVINGMQLEFNSLRQARVFYHQFGVALGEASDREVFDERHLTKDEIGEIFHRVNPLGWSSLSGKVWWRLIYISRRDQLVRFVCASCADYIHKCSSTSRICSSSSSLLRSRLEISSLLDNRDKIFMYEGPQIGPSVRGGFRPLVNAVEDGLV